MTKLKNISLTIRLLSSFSLILTGCGGSGGSGTATTPPDSGQSQVSSSCGFMQTEATDTCYNLTITNDTGTSQQRSFFVHQGQATTSPSTAVIFLHGGGGAGLDIERFFRAKELADKEGYLALFPSGVGQAWSSNVNTGSNRDDTDFLSRIIDTAIADYQVSPENIFVIGFSAGGFLSYKSACELSEKITGIVSVAGLVNGNIQQCEPSEAVAIHHIHGTADNIIPTSGGFGSTGVISTLDFWANINNCVVTETSTNNIEQYTSTGFNAVETEYQFCEKYTGYTMVQGAGHFIDFDYDKFHNIVSDFIKDSSL